MGLKPRSNSTGNPLTVSVFIRPGLAPMDRGFIEDQIVCTLGHKSVESMAGGTFMLRDGSGSESDFSLEASGHSKEAIFRTCKKVVAALKFPVSLRMRVVIEGEEKLYVVDGAHENGSA